MYIDFINQVKHKLVTIVFLLFKLRQFVDTCHTKGTYRNCKIYALRKKYAALSRALRADGAAVI